jgi:signal transduction histidine kinase/CheY-like chemotaxis protein
MSAIAVTEHHFLEVRPPGRPARPWARTAALNVLVAACYAGSGTAGLKLSFIAHAVTLFWPPSGLAMAAVWLGGLRLLPGIFLGAFIVNLFALGSAPLAALIATGNMLPSLIATLALRALLRRQRQAGELKRVLMFIAVAVLGATMASATVGTLAVYTIGHLATSPATTWLVWWMGDAMGVMIVAPPILLWRRVQERAVEWSDALAIAGLSLAGAAVIAALLLIERPIWAVELCKLFTLLLSLLAGARFGLNGPAWMTLLMAFGTVGITVLGAGPFLRGDFYDSFAFVHSYLFAEAVTGMLLAAALTDLRSTVQREKLARAAAEAAAAERIRLLAMISHDVRTPLSGIMGALQTLANARPTQEQDRLIGLGLRAGVTLTTLVTDLLDVARADAGRISLQVAPFSPAQSLADVVDMHRAAAAARQLFLTLDGIASIPALLLGDRIRFEQIIGNLLSNAVLYTRTGGVTVGTAWDEAQDRPLLVTVTDTGPGIDPSRLPQRFDAGAVIPTSGDRSAGLGLGLHICRRLVELMQGTLDCDTPAGGGSRFCVALPLRRGEAANATPAMARPDGPALHILLVEDDEIAGETTRALLQSHGHRVTLAADARTAMACAEAGFFDVILLDMQLATRGASGLDVVRHIRALPGPGALTQVFALTGDGLDDHHACYQSAGIDGLLLKPLMLDRGLAAALGDAAWPGARSRGYGSKEERPSFLKKSSKKLLSVLASASPDRLGADS